MGTPPRQSRAASPGYGLERVLSKLGVCSRSEARRRIEAGRVRVNGIVRCDPEHRTHPERDHLELDGLPISASTRVYLVLNKPRGLVTSAADEQGRATVFDCLKDAGLPHLSPVGRLDRASEGLLLLTNDTAWAARLTDPAARIDKTYHVQVAGTVADDLCPRLEQGVVDQGERLSARRVAILRRGGKNTWLEIVLDEGRNRHLRRLLAGFGFEVLRLVRVRIGALPLGNLAKGAFRHLSEAEVCALGSPATGPGRSGTGGQDRGAGGVGRR